MGVKVMHPFTTASFRNETRLKTAPPQQRHRLLEETPSRDFKSRSSSAHESPRGTFLVDFHQAFAVPREEALWQTELIAHRVACLEGAVRFFYDEEFTISCMDDIIHMGREAEIHLPAIISDGTATDEDMGISTLLSKYSRYSKALKVQSVTKHFASQIVTILKKSVQGCIKGAGKQSLLLCRGEDALIVHMCSNTSTSSEVFSHMGSNMASFMMQSRSSQTARGADEPHRRSPRNLKRMMEGMRPLAVFDPKFRSGHSQTTPHLQFFDSIERCDEYIGAVLGGTHTGTLAPIGSYIFVRCAQSPECYNDLPPLNLFEAWSSKNGETSLKSTESTPCFTFRNSHASATRICLDSQISEENKVGGEADTCGTCRNEKGPLAPAPLVATDRKQVDITLAEFGVVSPAVDEIANLKVEIKKLELHNITLKSENRRLAQKIEMDAGQSS